MVVKNEGELLALENRRFNNMGEILSDHVIWMKVNIIEFIFGNYNTQHNPITSLYV